MNRGFRAVLIAAGIAGLFGRAVAAPAPDPLPIALVASFDEALALVTAAAEQQIVAIEQRSSDAEVGALTAYFDGLDAEISVACDAATIALDTAISRLGVLSPIQRATLACCVLRHLVDTRRDLRIAIDRLDHARGSEVELAQREVDEYLVTQDRLLELRHLIG